MTAHNFHPSILRSYDIRGEVGVTLSVADAYFIGAGFGQIIRRTAPGRIAVGRDGRLTSPELAAALIDGLVAAGCEVIDTGVGPTPMLYFADRHFACDGAVQVTGSHNPPTHNGFKMVRAHKSFFGASILELAELCASGLNQPAAGTQRQEAVFDAYIARLLSGAEIAGMSVVWDAGNGAAGPAVEAITKLISGTHKTLFTDIDGHFPNHHPNPVDPQTLEILRAQTLSSGADCGIGFDGDGDRIGVVDARGRHIAGDILTAYLAGDILERHPGSEILFDVKSSASAMGLVRAAGGRPLLWKTGHSHMKQRLAELNAPLAGEMSGHIFIADDYFGFDDALYVALRLLGVMHKNKQRSGDTLADFIDRLPESFTTPECHIACPDDEKFSVMEQLSRQMSELMPTDQINLTDGVRLNDETGWCLVRASNTEGALIVRAEGHDESALNRFIDLIRGQLATAGIIWDGP